MAQSLAKNLIHLIFSTKQRASVLTPDICAELNAYLVGILRDWESPSIEVNCVGDHAHLLFCLSKNTP